MSFLDDKYLLETKIAEDLYGKVEDLPVIDLHNHADVAEIVLNKGWSDIWEVEAATDHYVWELMRKRGIEEDRITGNASNREKWDSLASVFPEFAGNPTYEWIHLDLKRRFGVDKLISQKTADEIWEITSEKLKGENMKPQALLHDMNIEVLCTTDDPTSDLELHRRASEEIESPLILPTWRPDKAMNIEKDSWNAFVKELGNNTGEDTQKLVGFLKALKKTHDFFAENGCIASDHGIEEPYSHEVSEDAVEKIHRKRIEGGKLSKEELMNYKAFLFMEFGRMNREKGWITQLHIGAIRDYRDSLSELLGPDSGGDISTHRINFTDGLKPFLNEFDGELDIVLYCLDPGHQPTLATISRAFPNVSLGAPWWFNDSYWGIQNQLDYVATVDLLYNHAGMVSDSRKLMSYGSRIEVFRRTLCNVVGNMVDRGQVPEKIAANMVEYISYKRLKDMVDRRI